MKLDKEVCRISGYEITMSKFKSLEGLLIGKNVLNNPNVYRMDDICTGDVVFYERKTK